MEWNRRIALPWISELHNFRITSFAWSAGKTVWGGGSNFARVKKHKLLCKEGNCFHLNLLDKINKTGPTTAYGSCQQLLFLFHYSYCYVATCSWWLLKQLTFPDDTKSTNSRSCSNDPKSTGFMVCWSSSARRLNFGRSRSETSELIKTIPPFSKEKFVIHNFHCLINPKNGICCSKIMSYVLSYHLAETLQRPMKTPWRGSKVNDNVNLSLTRVLCAFD